MAQLQNTCNKMECKNKRVLVTGSEGRIGRELVKLLEKNLEKN